MNIDPVAILGAGGVINQAMPGYETRSEQLKMARLVADAIESGSHLMLEAGTGVGKSFGYLVPAILAASQMDKRVVVSTRTINLQEQLIAKDIPFLRSVLPVQFKAALAKGRSNFVSLRRLEAAVARSTAIVSIDETRQLQALLRWSSGTNEGSFSDFGSMPAELVRESVESDSGNCLKQRCPRFRGCFFFKMVRHARTAEIIVVNHALYMSDLALRSQGASGVLPDHDVVIFDEAHGLASVAAQHLGLRVASGSIANLLLSLENERTGAGLLVFHHLEDARKQRHRALKATDEFFDSVASWQSKHGRKNGRVKSAPDWSNRLSDCLRDLAAAIGRGVASIDSPEQRIELESAEARCRTLALELEAWLRHDHSDSVYWVDVKLRPSRRVVLARSSLAIGEVLERELFSRVPTCVLTSATLSTGTPPSFQFSKAKLGLRPDFPCNFIGSPFDFQSQVTLYLGDGLPDPSGDPNAYDQAAIKAIPQFVQIARGKALVLFTSHKMMQDATRMLGAWFQSNGITLLSQSSRESRNSLLDQFKLDVNSVLFGTDSFWQGVDVPGEALSTVIITRLPFESSDHPVLEAHLERITRHGGSPFLDLQLPDAILKFKQGIGRLLRAKTDKGNIVILDPRVRSKGYGNQFLLSIPQCRTIVAPVQPVQLP